MKTVTTSKIVSYTLKSASLGYWDDEREEFVSITNENIGEVAKVLACSPALLDAILMTIGNIATAVHEDLAEI